MELTSLTRIVKTIIIPSNFISGITNLMKESNEENSDKFRQSTYMNTVHAKNISPKGLKY